MEFDDRRRASLDGEWDFFPGDHALDELDGLKPETIVVPALWETDARFLDLDGPAWYRRRFDMEDVAGGWTLRFGAVMDSAEVFLNGVHLGTHSGPFTPFEVDATEALRPGTNVLAVRVVDPSLDDPDHLRMAHGKQGWANNVFPSRPSLYMTYGGIWQTVTIRRHGRVVIRDVFVKGDPDQLVITAELENRGPSIDAHIGFRTLGAGQQRTIYLASGHSTTLDVSFGRSVASRWTPERPELHWGSVDVWLPGGLSDSCTVRYGLRKIAFEGKRLLIDGEPYRMKSVLVQGFRADNLYAEGSRESIEEEVRAAKAMGFNTLRLHIKAFDPGYLDVCDELGMLLHCDIPVAEPIAHEEMGGDTLLTQRCVAAAREQVRRDRNHPSIVLWSAMNEICDGRREARQWPQYESFARALYRAVRKEDPTRPVIENDWVEPDPAGVFESPILTAHWYGRLHRDYLDKIEAASARWADQDRPLFVTEFGDWGLPEMPELADPPFWDTRAVHAAGLADTLWPASVSRFARETQRYQGLADRLQAETFRRHDHIGGYCLTELTDVPFELNGLLDLHRQPKPLAVAEVTRMNQTVLPMLQLGTLVAAAGDVIGAPLYVANDGPALADVTVETRFGDSVSAMSLDELLTVDMSSADVPADQIEGRFGETVSEVRLGDVPAHGVHRGGEILIGAPEVAGRHDLVLRLRSAGREVAENRYPIHVIRPAPADLPVRLLGDPGGATATALTAVGARCGELGPAVVTEGALDAGTGAEVLRLLELGEVVLILAQEPSTAAHFPLPTTLEPLETAWGSTVFRFTTDHGAVPSLPRRNLLVGEDSTIHARHVIGQVDGRPFPDTPVVIAYKPFPGAITGTVIGSDAVGPGRLVYCQYRIARLAAEGDAAARNILADLVRWITRPRPVMEKRAITKDDGRSLTAYAWREDVAR